MIYLFRKEMRKWKNVLWLVLASFALGGLSYLFIPSRDSQHIAIAKVDGEKITLKNPLANILQKCKIGKESVLKVLRDKKEITLKVKLEERK